MDFGVDFGVDFGIDFGVDFGIRSPQSYATSRLVRPRRKFASEYDLRLRGNALNVLNAFNGWSVCNPSRPAYSYFLKTSEPERTYPNRNPPRSGPERSVR